MLLQYFFRHAARHPVKILLLASSQRNVKDQGHDRHAETPRQPQKRTPGAVLQIGRVNHREFAQAQAQAGEMVHQAEGFGSDVLCARVVANQRAAMVGGDDFGGHKMARRESGFARAGRADK